ncbi:calpain-5-like isoform X2 [Varroa jacobsoni]|uniref:Calpain-5 n=1 Tax=Varroa destructor TaxID=109461 RepID=A0A7M7J5S1_VARDE|nr:calpain-5-like isoform X2 [Varroa destructor]XP_022692862.1 calpain-5-like isoform X2 [Varroa jacobsoni]
MEPAVRCGLCSDVRVAELQYKCAQNTAARAMFIGRSSGVRPQGNQRRPLKKLNYAALRKTCIESGALWEDQEFRADVTALGSDGGRWLKDSHGIEPGAIGWKRPFELTDDPKFFVEGLASTDVTEGIAGNDWFVSAASALSREKQLFNKVIPSASSYSLVASAEGGKTSSKFTYCGLFRFMFYHFGRWKQVLIDDRLPIDPNTSVPLFAKSRTKDEFWPVLLEKAYAKYLGSYEALCSHRLEQALVDLTGGVAEILDIGGSEMTPQLKDELHARLSDASRKGSPLCAMHELYEEADGLTLTEGRLPCGIMKGRPYTVTGFASIDISASAAIRTLFGGRQQLRMVRLQDPWADSKYTGAFGQNSFKSHLSYSTRSLRRARNRALFNPCSSSSDPDICPNYVFHYGSSFHGNAGGARTRNPGVSSIRTVTASCQDHRSDERLIECQTDTEQNNRTEYMYSTKQLLRFHSSSVEWTRLSQIERSKLGLKIEQAAEFWVTYDDLLKYFTQFLICHLSRGATDRSGFFGSLANYGSSLWEHAFTGEWTIGTKGSIQDRAGGSAADSVLRNPQYLLEVIQEQAELIVYLMQESPFEAIGFILMKVEANRQFRLHRQKEVIYSSEFLALRDQLSRVGPIPRGRYILIPCTLEAEISQTYLVRVLAKLGAVVMRELLLDQPQKTFLSRKLPSLVTYVKIYGAKDLVKKTPFSMSPYCVIQCEGTSARSASGKGTSPQWKFEALFYRKDPKSSVTIQVWNHSLVMDQCLGRAILPPETGPELKEFELALNLKKCETPVGYVTVETYTTNDVLSV